MAAAAGQRRVPRGHPPSPQQGAYVGPLASTPFACSINAMVATRAQIADGQPARKALFEALLQGDAAKARTLLQRDEWEGSNRSHTGLCGFSTLHAAMAGGCADALPALVAAGAPLGGAMPPVSIWHVRFSGFLRSLGAHISENNYELYRGGSALQLAVRCVGGQVLLGSRAA